LVYRVTYHLNSVASASYDGNHNPWLAAAKYSVNIIVCLDGEGLSGEFPGGGTSAGQHSKGKR
jgi:hypothetical protein